MDGTRQREYTSEEPARPTDASAILFFYFAHEPTSARGLRRRAAAAERWRFVRQWRARSRGDVRRRQSLQWRQLPVELPRLFHLFRCGYQSLPRAHADEYLAGNGRSPLDDNAV